jgi:transcriptional regulator with XRE-family HTH domain
MALRDLIKDRLAARKLTQAGLAALIGRHPSYITDIMSGRKHRVQTRFVLPLANALHISPDDLYRAMTTVVPPSEAESQSPPPTVDHVVLGDELIAAWRKPTRILLPSGGGKVVPIFRTLDELMSGESELSYRWPLTLGWNPAAYGLLSEAGKSGSIYNRICFAREIVLVAPEMKIRRNETFIAFTRSDPFEPNFVCELLDRRDSEITVLRGGKLSIRIKALMRAHRILAIFDAQV